MSKILNFVFTNCKIYKAKVNFGRLGNLEVDRSINGAIRIKIQDTSENNFQH